MGKTVVIIMIITVLSKVLGFGRDIVLSHFYGATGITDAYLISNTIPTVFLSFIGLGFAASYIPISAKIVDQQGEAEAKKFTSNLANIIFLLCALVVAAILIFPTFFVKIFAFGFEGETLQLAVEFTMITSFSIIFIALCYVFGSYLEFNNRFLIYSFTGIPLNVIMMLFIYLSFGWNLHLLAIGVVISVIVQFLIMVPSIRKTGYRHSFTISLKEENVKKMLVLSLPVIIGIAVNQINVLVDRTIASLLVEGGISALTYSNRINLFIQAIFVSAVATVMFPKVAKLAVKREMESLKQLLIKLITVINLIVIPATVGLLVFSRQTTELLFGHGAFDEAAVSMTASTLFYYSIGMLGYGLREIIAKVFYSLEDMRTPMINAVIAMVINIALNVILSSFMGVNGLALATSISATLSTLLLYISLVKKIGSLNTRIIIINMIKILAASIVMGFGAHITYVALIANASLPIALFGGIGAGVIIYIVALLLLKLDDLDYYKDLVLSIVRKKKEVE